MRGRLIALFAAILLPVLLVQLAFGFVRYERRRADQLAASLALARSAGHLFSDFVAHVLHDAEVVGLALRKHRDPVRIAPLLLLSSRRATSVKALLWLDEEGRVLAASGPYPENLPLESTLGSIRAGEAWVVSDLQPGTDLHEPFFAVTRSMHDPKTGTTEAIMAIVEARKLDDVFLPLRKGSSTIGLLDRNLRMVYRYPEADLGWSERAAAVSHKFLRRVQAGEEVVGSQRRLHDGDKVLAGHVLISPMGWIAGAGRPEAETMAPIMQRLTLDALAFIFVSLAAALGGSVLALNITRPIRRLQDHAARLERGEPGESEALSGPREVRDLAASFSRMGVEIANREGRLKAQNEELRHKTEQLEALTAESEAYAERLFSQFKQISAIYDAINALVYVADMQTHEILFLNAYGEELFGTSALGRPCWEVLQEGQTGPCSFCTNPHLVSGGEMQAPYVWEMKNTKTAQWFMAIDRAIRWVDGRIVRLEIAVDISAQKAAELFREQYTGLISHDLRKPLVVLMSASEALLDRAGSSSSTIDEYAELIFQNARRMDAMISDLAESARLEDGHLGLERRAVDMAQLVRDVIQQTDTTEEITRIVVDIDDELPPVDVDAQRVERVVMNLLGNALKYSDKAEAVSVAVRRQEDAVCVAVSNRGVGIPADDVPGLFQRYYRASTAKGIAGLGLGLYIARLIVEAHGGRIWVESTPGELTTFAFTLPLENS